MQVKKQIDTVRDQTWSAKQIPDGERIDELAFAVSKNKFDGLVGVSLGEAAESQGDRTDGGREGEGERERTE